MPLLFSQPKAVRTMQGPTNDPHPHRFVEIEIWNVRNDRRHAATYTAISGVGGYYTIAFSDKANGSYALGYPVSIFGTTIGASGAQLEEQTATADWRFGNIYPNPGKGVAAITVTVPKAQRIAVDVINVAGQVLMTRTQQVTEGANKLALPVERLNAGSYLVRFRDAEGKTLNTQQYTRN